MGISGRGLPARGDARRCWNETEKALEAPQSEMRPRGETAGDEEEDMLGLGRAPTVGGGGNGDDDDDMFRVGAVGGGGSGRALGSRWMCGLATACVVSLLRPDNAIRFL